MPRPSPVSDAVRDVFLAGDRHVWSIDEVHAAVCASLGAADYSSVFRAVSGLERDGSIDRIDLGDGRARYELHDDHHEHVRCTACGRVAEIPGCVLDGAGAGVQSQTGFVVTSHHLVFSGICPACAPPTSA